MLNYYETLNAWYNVKVADHVAIGTFDADTTSSTVYPPK